MKDLSLKINAIEKRLKAIGGKRAAGTSGEELNLALDINSRLQASINDSNFSLLMLRMLEERYPGTYQRIDPTIRADLLDSSGVFADLLQEVVTEETGSDPYQGLIAVPKNPILS